MIGEVKHQMQNVFRLDSRLSILVFALLLLGPLGRNVKAQELVIPERSKPVAVIVLEIGRVTNKKFTRVLKEFDGRVYGNVQFYFINYGTNAEIRNRERLIINLIAFLNFDRSRITLLHGGLGNGPRTVVWKVPPGADYPKP